MCKRKISNLMPREVLERYKSAIQLVVIGPSTSGKSTLVYALVNHKIIGVIAVGIGDKSQTTIIPCNFVFDVRIEQDAHFALQVKKKTFASKLIHVEILDNLANLYCQHSMDAEETLEEINQKWFDEILEPESASYHLSRLKEEVDFVCFKEIVADILMFIENAEPSIQEQVKEKKKSLASQKVAISEIRRMVFEEVWEKLEPSVTEKYYTWLSQIGKTIVNNLNNLVSNVEILEMSVDDDDILPCGINILSTLFDPEEPYSLVIEDITIACRPRKELVEMAENDVPLRFCLRDTMGLTQIGMDPSSIKNALDVALNNSADSIMLLLSLEERDDVLSECCKAVSDKMERVKKLDVPVHVLFTKADRIIGNIINKSSKSTVELRQVDYDNNILPAISQVEKSINSYLDKIPKNSSTWLSLRYLEEEIDPIQIALKKKQDVKIEKFKPIGLYEQIDGIVKETQSRILPDGITNPVFVTVLDSKKPAIDIKIDGHVMNDSLNKLQHSLTQDTEVVNGYTIQTSYRIHGRSVVNYWRNLQMGLGYTTRAKRYGNFSINMKAMLNKQLNSFIPDLMTLYEEQAVATMGDNLSDSEISYLVETLDADSKYKEMAFYDINPALIQSWSEKQKNLQILHLVFRSYFAKGGKYSMVMDKVAYNLSYCNSSIREQIEDIYNAPISYDETIRELQKTFYNIFGTDDFKDFFAEEMGKTMSDLVNKMFISI